MKHTRSRAKFPVDGDKLRRACMAQGTLSRLSQGIGMAADYISHSCSRGFIGVQAAHDLESVYGIQKWMYVSGDMVIGSGNERVPVEIPFSEAIDDSYDESETSAPDQDDTVRLDIASDDDLGKAEALIKAGITFYFEYLRRITKC